MLRRFVVFQLCCVAMIVVGQHHPPIAVADGLAEPGGRGMVGWGDPLPSRSYVAISQTITPLETSAETAYNFFATNQYLTVPGTSQYVFPTSCYRSDGTPDPCHASGFYFGVQPSGTREDEKSQGPVALFSFWNATSATPGPDSMCRRFDWEGVGYLCRVDLVSIAGENTFRIERLNDGKSWRGTIRQPGGPEIDIGTHTYPDLVEAFAPGSWLEAYVKPTLCGSVPNGWARFSAPEITISDGTVRRMQVYATGTFHCPTSKSLVYDTCDAVFLGEGRPLRNPPTNVHEFVDTGEPGGWRYQAPTLLSARAVGNDRFSLNVRGCGLSPKILMSSVPLENTNSEALQLATCPVLVNSCMSSTHSLRVKALAQTAPNGTEQEHHFDTNMANIVALGDGNVCFTPFSSGRFGVSTCIRLTDIVARTNVSPIPSKVPRLVGKSCTKAQSVRTTQTGKLVCRSTSRGLVWRLSR